MSAVYIVKVKTHSLNVDLEENILRYRVHGAQPRRSSVYVKKKTLIEWNWILLLWLKTHVSNSCTWELLNDGGRAQKRSALWASLLVKKKKKEGIYCIWKGKRLISAKISFNAEQKSGLKVKKNKTLQRALSAATVVLLFVLFYLFNILSEHVTLLLVSAAHRPFSVSQWTV